MPTPTLTDVERIANLADPVMRNLQITQCYHELGLALAERTGGGANWCAFATWASKQAGQTIRKEDLGRTLTLMLGSEAAAQEALQELMEAARWLGARLKIEGLMEVLWKAYDPQAAFERASEAVARGNLKVFAEIGQSLRPLQCRIPGGPGVRRREDRQLLRGAAAGRAAGGAALPAAGFRALLPGAVRGGREAAHGAAAAGKLRDRLPRADAPAAGDQ